MSRNLIAVHILTLAALCATASAEERLPRLPHLMNSDPQLPVAEIEYYLPPRIDGLWHDALNSNDEDLRRETATVLMRLSQLDPQAVDIARTMEDDLRTAFRTSTSQTVRHTIASTLMQLDIRDAADELYEFSQSGSRTVQRSIEPVLADWQYEPIQPQWLERLRTPSVVPAQSLLLAIHGLATTASQNAVGDLQTLAADPTRSAEQRLAAAEALGQLTESGLNSVAEHLAASASAEQTIDRLVAVRMLAGHRGESTVELLLQLAQDPQPTVAATALELLLAIDPQLIHPVAEQLLSNPDGTIRRLTARSLQPGAGIEAVQRLATLLNDPHPDVRNSVREILQSLADQEDAADEVIRQTARLLAGQNWRELEQATRLAVHLDHKPSAVRLVELLRNERAEVKITAAWGLRELQVEETLPGMMEAASNITGRYWTGTSSNNRMYSTTEDACLSFLFEAMGRAQYEPAIPVLQLYISKKGKLGRLARSTSIWALGYICAEDPPASVVRRLVGRMSDDSRIVPEFMQVRVMSAVSLGRMKVEAAMEPTEQVMLTLQPHRRLRIACQWAISQMAGTPMEPLAARRVQLGAAFLRPIEPE